MHLSFVLDFLAFLLVWCPLNPKYHRTDAKCAKLPIILTPDLHMQNQPEMGSKSYPQIVSPAVGMPRTCLGIENFLVLFILTICVKSRSVGIYMQVPSGTAIATFVLKSENKV